VNTSLDVIADVLETVNAFPHLIAIPGSKFSPNAGDRGEADWSEISRCWIELAFALAREAREGLDQGRFRLWIDRLKAVVAPRSEFEARWFYEEALFCLFRLDQEGLTRAIANWPPMPELPFWESKRAGLLAELGRTDEAERIAGEALTKIRSRLQPYRTDYSLLSQEGFIMLLLKAVGSSKRLFQNSGERFRARWDKLDTFGCNPWREIELFGLELGSPQPKFVLPREHKIGFDPEAEMVTGHDFSGLRIQDHRPAFGLLRFYEEGGVPMRCGMVNLFTQEGAIAAKWILPFAPLWSLAVLLRTGQDKWIQEIYSRVRLAVIAPEAVNSIFGLCSEALRQSIARLSRDPEVISCHMAERLITTLRELLSRLSFRLDEEQRAHIFEFGLQLYRLGASRADQFVLEHTPALLERSA
jgi:hypothetical protein